MGSLHAPEADLQILGPEVRSTDILEIGCVGSQSSVYLARRGARVVAVDLSPRQLAHAGAHARARGAALRFIESSAEDLL